MKRPALMKRPAFCNGPTLLFILVAALLLWFELEYGRSGPAGLDHAPTLLTTGGFFAFCGVYALASTRAESLRWMRDWFTRGRRHEGEGRVVAMMLGALFTLAGLGLVVRGLVLL